MKIKKLFIFFYFYQLHVFFVLPAVQTMIQKRNQKNYVIHLHNYIYLLPTIKLLNQENNVSVDASHTLQDILWLIIVDIMKKLKYK